MYDSGPRFIGCVWPGVFVGWLNLHCQPTSPPSSSASSIFRRMCIAMKLENPAVSSFSLSFHFICLFFVSSSSFFIFFYFFSFLFFFLFYFFSFLFFFLFYFFFLFQVALFIFLGAYRSIFDARSTTFGRKRLLAWSSSRSS
ncbi:hypothetical protein M434DRAFT_158543 [Hypoxylon sp. CO27-5]|nr:hypothetical protein M434DRAFT_158543 [Hypoxylon sp. CO27-5]